VKLYLHSLLCPLYVEVLRWADPTSRESCYLSVNKCLEKERIRNALVCCTTQARTGTAWRGHEEAAPYVKCEVSMAVTVKSISVCEVRRHEASYKFTDVSEESAVSTFRA
jgi:hypothetical protein